MLDPWPPSLPDAIDKPDGGTYLPPRLSKFVQKRLLKCETLPVEFAAVLELSSEVQRAQSEVELVKARVEGAQEMARKYGIEYSGHWAWWQVGLAVGGGIIGGFVIGGFVGLMVER